MNQLKKIPLRVDHINYTNKIRSALKNFHSSGKKFTLKEIFEKYKNISIVIRDCYYPLHKTFNISTDINWMF